jgi:hypothetical protein
VALDAETRQAAIDALLAQLDVAHEAVRVDPSRTVVAVGPNLWTLVAVGAPPSIESGFARRAGAKHKQVRN